VCLDFKGLSRCVLIDAYVYSILGEHLEPTRETVKNLRQSEFFDVEDRAAQLTKMGDLLVRLKARINTINLKRLLVKKDRYTEVDDFMADTFGLAKRRIGRISVQ